MHERGDVADVLEQLTAKGFVYENDGARWLRSTDFGDQRDRVLVRSDGSTTYLCNDLAYHRDKFRRGFTHLIDIWGADHHGQVKSLQSGMEALGFDAGEPEIILGQFVKVVKDGQDVSMSKRDRQHHHARRHPRRGRSRRRAHDVPVAGHRHRADVRPRRRDRAVAGEPRVLRAVRARAHRVDRAQGRERRASCAQPLAEVDLSLLVHEREDELLRALANYPDAIHEAAEVRAPQKVSTWVRDFAGEFHGFYRDCKVLSDDAALDAGAAVAHRGVPDRARERARRCSA